MNDTFSFKCPSCGGVLKYGGENRRFICESCGGDFSFDEVNNADVNAEKGFNWGDYTANTQKERLEGTVSYICKSCGAEIVTDATTAATKCPYCDNVVVVEPNLSGLIKPNLIIPFKVDKKQLSLLIKGFCKGKPLLPKNFINDNKINEVKGIYVPFWLFKCRADGKITYDATKVRTWSDSNYHYTETSHFYVTCDGGMSFENIPVDGGIKMDDKLMDSLEPFDFSELTDFAPGYLSGFLADRFDADANDSFPRADNRVRQSVDDLFRRELKGYSTVTKLNSRINLSDTDVSYALLPVYLISSKFNDKIFQFAVNGQTGKVVGELPCSKLRLFAWLTGLLIGISAIAFVIAMFIMGWWHL